jgi:hypothetical protein
LLLFAARQEHLHSVIVRPSLLGSVSYAIALPMRHLLSGMGRGIDLTKLETLESWVQGQLNGSELYFDLPRGC